MRKIVSKKEKFLDRANAMKMLSLTQTLIARQKSVNSGQSGGSEETSFLGWRGMLVLILAGGQWSIANLSVETWD